MKSKIILKNSFGTIKKASILVGLFLFYVISITKGQVGIGNATLYEKPEESLKIMTFPDETPDAQFIDNQTIIIDVNTLYNKKADNYLAIFNLRQVGETAKSTNQMANQRIDSMINHLEKIGISKDEIFVDMISFVPVFEYEVQKRLFSKTYNEIPKGFKLQKNLHIKFDDASKLNEIISICADYELYNLASVEYYINDVERLYDSLRLLATKLVNKRISFCKKNGMDISSEYNIIAEDYNLHFPKDRYYNYQAFDNTALDVIKKKSQIKHTSKEKTFYYKAISFRNYDAVINPNILEPEIQISLNLKVKFIIKEKESEKHETIQKQYFIISSDGNLKTLSLD